MLRVILLGDIVGKSGRNVVKRFLPDLKSKYNPHIIIANVENSAGGLGVTAKIAQELKSIGIDYMTSGNHIWKHKDIYPFMEKNDFLIRPINYPSIGTPGKGYIKIAKGSLWNKDIYIVNAIGRIFMENNDCPFRAMDNFIKGKEDSIIILDFHAEATSEKIAMGWYLSKRVSIVVGTHTHVQTADERILENHTAYISDLGMCGAGDTVIGVDRNIIIQKLLTSRPVRFKFIESDNIMLNGVMIDIDDKIGKAINIERLILGSGDFSGKPIF